MANPWIYDSVSFDSHFQSVGAACFAMLACREMIRGSIRLLALWVILCLACGDIAGTYLAAVGLGGVLMGRAYRRRGAALLVLGAGWFLLASALGGGKGSDLAGHYGYLTSGPATSGSTSLGVGGLVKGLLHHPSAVVQHLWAARVDLWAYSMSSGGLGLFTPLSILPLLVLFQGGIGEGPSLRSVAYENFGVMLFVAPLTVLVLAWLTGQLAGGWLADHLPKSATGWLRSTRFPFVVAALLGINAIAWGAVWIPQVPAEWLRTSTATSSTLDDVARLIPPSAEVVASQGVMGRLCGRQWCYKVARDGPLTIPLHTNDDYFVIVPYQGIETSSVQTQLGMIEQLAGPLHATLLVARDGVWLFRLARPPDIHVVKFRNVPDRASLGHGDCDRHALPPRSGVRLVHDAQDGPARIRRLWRRLEPVSGGISDDDHHGQQRHHPGRDVGRDNERAAEPSHCSRHRRACGDPVRRPDHRKRSTDALLGLGSIHLPTWHRAESGGPDRNAGVGKWQR